MKRWIALVAALLTLAPMALAGEVSESITNKNVGGPPQYYWGPNNHWERFEGDASGVPYVTERYPYAFQEAGVIVVSALALGTTVANSSNPLLGTGLTPYMVGVSQLNKWARILVTGAPTNSPPWSVRFYGSRDGVNYAPLMRSSPPTGDFIGVDGGADTLKFRGRGAMTGNGVWFPLYATGGYGNGFKFITAVCSSDSTNAVANYTFTVEIQGRQQ